ncbi:TetR family transcriptional regulator [Isoptericola jiangsuensis]|uniref:TetR family transcriptional regulator n=1 Tax=Isoptericola jiangsuensis TaxID=548579 RepID=A0A2A9EV17_9MICO|nr:TetR/AcrR family transcriptional regulator [Isoptericola jiangsuensis]PFG42603.1 TetR family transcriptional regulator [Isoptericola jiangsuensis]
MDPRQQRTRASLRAAILELAGQRPVGTLTVAEVARAAGVTRDTFYRHTTSPVELLAGVLEEELRQIEPPTRDGDDDFVRAETRLLRHVAAHREIYRAALVDGADGRLREVLHEVIAARLDEYLREHPDVAPPVPGGLPADTARTVLVAYSAAGTVGAIGVWLRDGGDEADIPALARTVIAGGPPAWAGSVAGAR